MTMTTTITKQQQQTTTTTISTTTKTTSTIITITATVPVKSIVKLPIHCTYLGCMSVSREMVLINERRKRNSHYCFMDATHIDIFDCHSKDEYSH